MIPKFPTSMETFLFDALYHELVQTRVLKVYIIDTVTHHYGMRVIEVPLVSMRTSDLIHSIGCLM